MRNVCGKKCNNQKDGGKKTEILITCGGTRRVNVRTRLASPGLTWGWRAQVGKSIQSQHTINHQMETDLNLEPLNPTCSFSPVSNLGISPTHRDLRELESNFKWPTLRPVGSLPCTSCVLTFIPWPSTSFIMQCQQPNSHLLSTSEFLLWCPAPGGCRTTDLKFKLCHPPLCWPWENYLISPNLSSLIFKIDTDTIGHYNVQNK